MKSHSKSRYVSLRNFVKLSNAEKDQIVKILDEKVKKEIAESEDPIDKTVDRKFSTVVRIEIKRVARPVVESEQGIDVKDIAKLLK